MELKNNVYYVGKIDWQLRKFHGEELSTHRGTSFNSYLIKDEKVALIDTVWKPFTADLIRNISKYIDISKIDYIITNHGEPDHSGALPEIMSLIPDVPIYCTANGAKSLKGYYHKDWNFKTVKTGDRLNLGSQDLMFIEAPMLHWPDTMVSYLTGDKILFSNDIFGQHFASEFMLDEKVDYNEVYYEALKYYANIITPFSKKASAKVAELKSMNLPIDMIAPAHGIIWTKHINDIINNYEKWAESYRENQITIAYDTMYNSTRLMAESIAKGIQVADKDVTIKIFDTANTDKNDLITEIFRSKGLLVGSPTINNGILSSVASILEEIKGMGFTGKCASAFGSYGWSPASVKIINQKLEEAGFNIITEGFKAQWNPTSQNIEECMNLGQKFVEGMK